MADYDLEQVVGSYNWLGHEGVTELFARHPEFRPGKEHYQWNRERQTFPVTAYAGTADDVVAFVKKYAGPRMVCMSLNDRPEAYRNERGYPRAARENEIVLSRNLMVDVDFEEKSPTQTQLSALEAYVRSEVVSWYRDLGFVEPALSSSGRGFHLFSGYAPIIVAETPDIAQRVRKFNIMLHDDHQDGLGNIGAEVDTNVFDLRRMVKIPSTAKPDVGVNSIWYGAERSEDGELRTYLLSMVLDESKQSTHSLTPIYGPSLISAGGELPELFRNLLKQDEKLRNLWQGHGKLNGDTSRTGYDYSIARRLLVLGYRDIDNLATVLAVRPDGAVKQAGKDEIYIRRTIASAIHK